MKTIKTKIKELKGEKLVIFVLIQAFALIFFWRGVWLLLDELLFPENPILSAGISIFLGIVAIEITFLFFKPLLRKIKIKH